LTPESLRGILQKVYVILLPFFLAPDIISQSEYDKYGPTDLQRLKEELENINTRIIRRRGMLQKTIGQQLNKELTIH